MSIRRPLTSLRMNGMNGMSRLNNWIRGDRWNQAITSAEKIVGSGPLINPKELLGSDLSLLTENIRKLLGSGHPVLNTLSAYYFSSQGKHVRPLIVLLMAQASSLGPKIPSFQVQTVIDAPISPSLQVGFASTSIDSPSESLILPAQRRLAEITEMIHTASLLHDDVIDTADTRRNAPSANAEFGNKMAILAGDFLLARASIALARLRNLEVVELLATVISNLVEGEFMQLRNKALESSIVSPSTCPPHLSVAANHAQFEYYMEKTYLKTASLIAKSCRAVTVLGGCTTEVGDMAYLYGKNLGLAFQLIDDMLDFVVTADEFGKPVNADLSLGLATAPVLYAAETFPELYPLIERKFDQPGDVARAKELVFQSNGIQKTKELATYFCTQATDALSGLPSSSARTALIQLTEAVLTRKK